MCELVDGAVIDFRHDIDLRQVRSIDAPGATRKQGTTMRAKGYREG